MRKIGMVLLLLSLMGGWLHPVRADEGWDVTISGADPYTLQFTGQGIIDITSDETLTYEGYVTGQALDIQSTPSVTVKASQPPRIVVTEAASGKSVVFDLRTPAEPAGDAPADADVNLEDEGQPEPTPPAVTETKIEQRKATGTVEGTVWYDENVDGVRQDTESRLNDVSVFLLNARQDVVGMDITHEGQYVFQDVKPGTYTLKIDGYDIGLQTFTPKGAGADRLKDSDVNQDGVTILTVTDRRLQRDAGLIAGEDGSTEAHFMTVTNFFDADHDTVPSKNEQSLQATYALTDTATGRTTQEYARAGQKARMVELPLGFYRLTVEPPAGYAVKAVYEVTFPDPEAGQAMMQATTADAGFKATHKRVPLNDPIDMTQNRQGTGLVVALIQVKQAKPVPVKTPPEPRQEQKPTVPTLPQAGEDDPFPFAVVGLAVVGLWLIVRRG